MNYPDLPFSDWLREHGPRPLSFQEVAYFVRLAANALQEVHNRRQVYLNLSPASFLVRADEGLPSLRLVPGGVAPLIGPSLGEASNALYLAPEQWQGIA